MQATATPMTTEEQLAEHVARLARKTEALDDFAALVAHDVKSSLVTALRDEDPREGLTRALELVDSILEAVRADQAATGGARLADCVQRAIADLGDSRTEIVASVTGEFPMPPDALRCFSGTCSQTRSRPARNGFTSRRSPREISACSSSTTTASASPRGTTTRRARSSGSPVPPSRRTLRRRARAQAASRPRNTRGDRRGGSRSMIRVLLVDDHAVFRSSLRLRLEQEDGIEPVGEAGTAEQAIGRARVLKPDVVLIDLLLPRKSGYQAIPEILSASPESRILVVSSQTGPTRCARRSPPARTATSRSEHPTPS